MTSPFVKAAFTEAVLLVRLVDNSEMIPNETVLQAALCRAQKLRARNPLEQSADIRYSGARHCSADAVRKYARCDHPE
jgi:hypothetical protein